MAQLFDRRCVLLLQAPNPDNFIEPLPGATIVDGLRVKFTIKKTLESSPNQSTVEVYNLSPTHRAAFQKKGTKVYLQAGYKDTVRQIFSGDSRRVENIQTGPDWVTKVTLGDGERAYRFARFSETFTPGATVETVVRSIAAAMKLDATDAVAQTRAALGPGSLDSFFSGYSFHGQASVALDSVLSSLGLTWSIQDGKLQVLAPGTALGGTVPLWSPSSGLIGSPAFGTSTDEKKPARLTAKNLLDPSVQCGGALRVETRSIKGQFKVHTLTHEGDTHGGDWMTTTELEP